MIICKSKLNEHLCTNICTQKTFKREMLYTYDHVTCFPLTKKLKKLRAPILIACSLKALRAIC